jgi:hypothetical protein
MFTLSISKLKAIKEIILNFISNSTEKEDDFNFKDDIKFTVRSIDPRQMFF